MPQLCQPAREAQAKAGSFGKKISGLRQPGFRDFQARSGGAATNRLASGAPALT